jgi:hypothetical protein
MFGDQYPQFGGFKVLEWGSVVLLVVALLYFVRAQTGSELRGFARFNPIRMLRSQSYGARGAQHLDHAKRWAVLALFIAVIAYTMPGMELGPKVLPEGQLAGTDGKPIPKETMARAMKMSALFAVPALIFIFSIGGLIVALAFLYDANYHRVVPPRALRGPRPWNLFRRTDYTQVGLLSRRKADRCLIIALAAFVLFLVSLGLFRWFTLNFMSQ